MGDIFRILFYQPTFNVLVFFYRLLGSNLGWAIVAVAVFSRVLTYPMTKAQIKSAERGKEFQKQYDALKKKYGKNKEKLNEQMAKLQAKYLPGQLGGCLPMIILIIFLIQVRNVIRAIVESGAGAFNEVAYPFISKFADGTVINLNFLGMDLSKVAADFSWSDHSIIPYAVLAVLVGLTQLFSTQILSGIRTFGAKKEEKKEVKKKKKKDDDMPDMSQMMGMASKQMMFIFPIFTIVTSLGYWGGAKVFPSGVSIFWTVQSLFVIIQQLIMNKEKVIAWFNLKVLKNNERQGPDKKSRGNSK
ncbi:MAG: membrane protein insertase YidC [Patescibacteria group bacterium]|nr:YidC/Oxa1 family membrane protein insertase [Patescibacteria group bacterium]